LTGGEPFLRDDLVDIAKCFYHNSSRSRQITIPSSGQHPEKIHVLVKELLKDCPELILEIQLSIDGVQESHDAIRGKGQFERLMRTYELLKPIQDRNQRLRIRFNFTFSAQSEESFMDTFNFVVKELGNPHFDMVLVRRATADASFFEPANMDLYRQATQFLQEQEREKANGLLEKLLAERAGVEREIIRSHYQKKPMLENCQAGTLTAILSEEGELRPCEILDTSFGNIRDFDYRLDKVWRHQLAEEHRDTIKRDKCYCTFETSVRTTMVFQPKWLLKTLLEQVRTRIS
jgi:MoaA/NifB/PqqE/SkfB family radical SAM enzyme